MEECTICLEDIGPRSKLGVIECGHYYHDHCILQWSGNTNSCPTCRELFHKISIKYSNEAKVISTLNVQDKLLESGAINNIPAEYIIPANQHVPIQNTQDQQDQISGICYLCSSANYLRSLTRDLISCIACFAKFHTNCLGLSQEPLWFCPICDHSQESVRPTRLLTATVTSRRGGSRRGRGRGRGRSTILHTFRHMPQPALLEYDDIVDDDDTHEPEPAAHPEGFYDELDANETEFGPTRAVVNGGVIARKEKRQLEALSPEEAKAWEVFEQVKHGNTEEGTMQDFSEQQENRRRRKRKARLDQTSEPLLATDVVQGRTRISSLINQIKSHSNHQVPVEGSSHSSPQSLSPLASNRQSLSPQALSPQALSPVSPQALSPQTMSPQTMSPQTMSPKPTNMQTLNPDEIELTFDHKSKIQKIIRDKLRPLYKRSVHDTGKLITTEDEYIAINKSASRKIYSEVIAIANNNDEVLQGVFNTDNHDKLRDLVNDFTERELQRFRNN